MHLRVWSLAILNVRLQILRRHPDFRRECAAKILYVDIAAHRDDSGVVGWAFKRVHLVGDNSSSHAVRGFYHDAQTRSEGRSTHSSPHLHVVICREIDHVVEIVPAYMVCTF